MKCSKRWITVWLVLIILAVSAGCSEAQDDVLNNKVQNEGQNEAKTGSSGLEGQSLPDTAKHRLTLLRAITDTMLPIITASIRNMERWKTSSD
jgi:hypothetical protein